MQLRVETSLALINLLAGSNCAGSSLFIDVSLLTIFSLNSLAYSLFSAPFSRASSSTDQVGGLHGSLPSLQKTSPSKHERTGLPRYPSRRKSTVSSGTPRCFSNLLQPSPASLLTSFRSSSDGVVSNATYNAENIGL